MNNRESDLDDIEWALWVRLMCDCDMCDANQQWEEHDQLLEADPIKWSKLTAPLAKTMGWTSPKDAELRCPRCSLER